MNIGSAIKIIDTMIGLYGEDHVVEMQFGEPCSWRGNYSEVAFEHDYARRTLGEAKALFVKALTETFEGWKGGEYTYDERTTCYLDNPGEYRDEEGTLFDAAIARFVFKVIESGDQS